MSRRGGPTVWRRGCDGGGEEEIGEGARERSEADRAREGDSEARRRQEDRSQGDLAPRAEQRPGRAGVPADAGGLPAPPAPAADPARREDREDRVALPPPGHPRAPRREPPAREVRDDGGASLEGAHRPG